jgi:hypothetical protein
MDASLELMWSKYRGWTKRARTIRGELDRWRLRTLVLTVIGAVLATLAAQLQLPGWFPDLNGFAQALQAQRDTRRTSGSPSRTNSHEPGHARTRKGPPARHEEAGRDHAGGPERRGEGHTLATGFARSQAPRLPRLRR